MEQRRKAGRPKGKVQQEKRLRAVYLDDADYARCVKAADPMTFSQWARVVLLEKAGAKR